MTYLQDLIQQVLPYNRSSLPDVFCKKGVIKNSAKFTGKTPVSGHRCFPVNFAKFLTTPFL